MRVWDPPRRVVFDGGDDGEGMAFEWLGESRAGGTCVVRLVNSESRVGCPTSGGVVGDACRS